jgi:hypothetical protein
MSRSLNRALATRQPMRQGTAVQARMLGPNGQAPCQATRKCLAITTATAVNKSVSAHTGRPYRPPSSFSEAALDKPAAGGPIKGVSSISIGPLQLFQGLACKLNAIFATHALQTALSFCGSRASRDKAKAPAGQVSGLISFAIWRRHLNSNQLIANQRGAMERRCAPSKQSVHRVAAHHEIWEAAAVQFTSDKSLYRT